MAENNYKILTLEDYYRQYIADCSELPHVKILKQLDNFYKNSWRLMWEETQIYKEVDKKEDKEYIHTAAAKNLFLYISTLENDSPKNYKATYYLQDIYKTFYFLQTLYNTAYNKEDSTKAAKNYMAQSIEIYKKLENIYINTEEEKEEFKNYREYIDKNQKEITKVNFPVKYAPARNGGAIY